MGEGAAARDLGTAALGGAVAVSGGAAAASGGGVALGTIATGARWRGVRNSCHMINIFYDESE
jgi:hypothetical protein